MPTVDISSNTGKISINYTICTPGCQAEIINQKLPTLLFITPILSTEHIFHAQFSDLQLRRFNLVVVDFRGGIGDTQADKIPPKYGHIEAAEDTVKFMDALHLPPCHIIGMSTSTAIAIELAISYSNRVLSLFLISPLCIEIPSNVVTGLEEIYELWTSAFPDRLTVLNDNIKEAQFGIAQYMFTDPSQTSTLARAMNNISLRLFMNQGSLGVFRTLNLDFFLGIASYPTTSLAKIAGPVHLIYGANDVAYSQAYPEEFLHQLRKAQVSVSLYVLSGAPHYIIPDFGKDVNQLLFDFIISNHKQVDLGPAPSNVMSPWEDILRKAGWEGEDEEELIFSVVPFRSVY